METVDTILIMITFILLVFISIECTMQYRFRRLRCRMIETIKAEVGCDGDIIAPDDRYPGAYNCTRDEPEYVFHEYSADRGQRKILITKDCAFIHALAWENPNEFEVDRE